MVGGFSFVFLSIRRDAFSLVSGIEYTPPVEIPVKITTLSWVNQRKSIR